MPKDDRNTKIPIRSKKSIGHKGHYRKVEATNPADDTEKGTGAVKTTKNVARDLNAPPSRSKSALFQSIEREASILTTKSGLDCFTDCLAFLNEKFPGVIQHIKPTRNQKKNAKNFQPVLQKAITIVRDYLNISQDTVQLTDSEINRAFEGGFDRNKDSRVVKVVEQLCEAINVTSTATCTH